MLAEMKVPQLLRVKSLKVMSSTMPPRDGWDLKRTGAWFSSPQTQFSITTLRMHPEISLPIATPCPPSKLQFCTRMFMLGLATLRPSSFLPLLTYSVMSALKYGSL